MNMRAFHFLSGQNALSDIALKRIRLSRYADLNDPFELFAGKLDDKRFRQAVRAWKDDFHKTKGLLCFSKNWGNPVLWSHYAEKHRGVCLGFDILDDFAVEMKYSDVRLDTKFKNNDVLQGLDPEFVTELLKTKFSHWKYEEEIRCFLGLDEGTIEGGNYFYPFSKDIQLREVILGPLCPMPIENVKALVKSIYDSVQVRKARLAFKWFKVVPDERYENL